VPRPPRVAIFIRRAEPGDFEGVWRMFFDERVYSGTLQVPQPSKEMWRKRFAELADGWLNVFRLEPTVFTDNRAAIALYRKFGFEMEGTHRAYALRAGRYVDAHAMARVRPKPVRV
jgi:hypothetical protein